MNNPWVSLPIAAPYVLADDRPYIEDFGHSAIRLPSQQYSFDLVRSFLARSALVIIARNYKGWVSEIPELLTSADNVVRLNSTQNIAITRNNLPVGTYDRLVEVLRTFISKKSR